MRERVTVDFHAHILPGVDHGATDTEQSLAFLRAAAAAGLRTIVATPHFYPHEHEVERFLKRRDRAYDALHSATQEPTLPSICLGAEILLCPGLEKMEGIEKLQIGETKLLLVELPFSVSASDDRLFETLECLMEEKGLSVILAHPNRYASEAVDRALALGCRLQINAEDLVRWRKRCAVKQWQKVGAVFALGSDAHRDVTVYQRFVKAQAYLKEHIQAINQNTDQVGS